MITSDYHIHTKYSCDGACMSYDTLINKAKEKGIIKYGITDHIHTPFNHNDIKNSYNKFQEKKVKGMHFGVEVSCISRWELDRVNNGDYSTNITYGIREGGKKNSQLAVAIDSQFIKRYKIEYVIGGTHWPMYCEQTREALIKDYHRQNLFLANNEHIDIVAHPWWYMGPFVNTKGIYDALPWFDDFKVISNTLHKEFAKALINNNKYHEINLNAILLSKKYTAKFIKQYINYLLYMKELGVKFAIGSDCHSIDYSIDFDKANVLLDKYGLSNDFTL